ncbi:unnamed protein product [Adineta ricciae]|uniref:Uncharacterized protein n=1 Tax=Adineta ricciae TaxID=249248 RepID=A0A814AP15_ADIRI|nr:unnamed protein product [Adineta ricciae]CAF1009739.1 unnamed protein product [Adineta ricciae]
MLVLTLLLFAITVAGQSEQDTSTVGYTNYQTSSTDNCTRSTSICTGELPFNITNPPDVWLDATVDVPLIELRVDNIQARLNLDARVASLVNLTAGVSVGISSVQIKIAGVHAQVQLAVKFDKIVDIVNRTLESIDLNPLLARTIKGVQNTTYLFCTVLYFIYISSLVLAQTNNSSCPTNRNSPCTALPFNTSNPPDVWLHVPDLSVQEISIVVEDIKAHVSLSANVAGLVSLNAGVDVSIDKVNLTITGVRAQVQLAVYLDNVATIITRTMASLDLNPLLTSVIDGVFQTVNNLLGRLTQNGQLINQIIDSTGKIVNQVLGTAGEVLSSVVVGDYQQNMTFTGVTQTLDNGNVIKQYSYPPPAGSSQTDKVLVNVLTDASGKVLSATVVNPPSIPTTTSSTSTSTNAAASTMTSTRTVSTMTTATITTTSSTSPAIGN